ncbi:MAG: aminotransferase class V-fold PLP-dependent enzyme, partial [Pyrinomonadaceae bacterium]|nr:aminotransferase class V-fold PLP-dependent enzyme [Pyrinomonadaceae bacterium]
MERREFFRRTGGVAALGLWGSLLPGSAAALGDVLQAESQSGVAEFASDDAFWRKVRGYYAVPTDFLDLDHANTSPTSSTVLEAFIRRSKDLSGAPAERYGKQLMGTASFRAELAKLLGTNENHYALMQNATVGLNTVLHGFPLKAGDEILVTNHEYPDMVEVVLQRAKRDGVVVKTVEVPGVEDDKLVLVERVRKAITAKTKLLLISHVSAWSGEVLPVAEVTKAARERGVAVLVDAAQSVGMLHVNFEAIGCDFLATSLHKWLGGPIATGVLIMKPEHVGKVWPLHPPSWDTSQYPMDLYEWSGSINMAANASIGEA